MKKEIQRPFKDERDEQIDTRSKSMALDFMIAATQVLTVICLIKGNPAWKGSFSLLLAVQLNSSISLINMKKSHIFILRLLHY